MNETTYQATAITNMAEKDKAVPKLALIEEVLAAFHDFEISYCHWKSNEHLAASMTADTDLDILFDEKQKTEVAGLLHKYGFKKFDSIKQKQYKDIEDYIGLDLPSGKIVHLHTHFRLTLGEAYLKGYQLNLENDILSSRVFDETFGIYRVAPAFELILLFFRQALKSRNRDLVRLHLKNKVSCSENVLREYKWLKQRCTGKEVETLLKKMMANYQPVYELVTGDLNRKQLFRLSHLLKKEFKKHRLYSPVKALVLRWYREASITFFRKSSRLLHQPILSQRINSRGGLVVAVIGADGSGKSTVIANLQSTFRKKLDVYRVYLGNGRYERKSAPRKLLIGLKKMLDKTGTKKRNYQQGNKADHHASVDKRGWKANLFRCLQALVIANERYKNLKLMQSAKRKGMLVICDRFPQNQIMGYNDGPMLHDLSGSTNVFFRWMSKLEAKAYAYAESHPPDILFKLVADAAVVQVRKPSKASLHMLEAKIKGIKELQFAAGCRVCSIDATQPLENVLFAVKKEVWHACP